MPKQKPIPKTAKEISQEQITPYLGIKSNNSGSLNRGEQISRKNDNVKDITIGLDDIDSSIIYYFDNVIKPTVVEKGESIKVPILYGSPERWKAVQKDGFYRTKDGKIMVPLIMFKRTSLEKNRDLGTKLDGNEAHLFQIVEKKYTQRNQYDRFSILNNRIPVKEYYTTIIPDYVTITYSCIVFTNYIEQMNKMIESINFASDSYWGDKNRFKFKARIDNFQSVTELNQGEDRLIKTNFNIILNGYIIPDSVNKYIAEKPNKFYSKCQVVFTLETTTGLDTFTATPQSNIKPNTVTVDSFNKNYTNIVNVNISSGSSAYLTYLNTNLPLVASSVTLTTALFNNGFLAAPDGLPTTSVNNFTFFVNGQYVEPTAISSFIDNGNNTCTLTIDPIELGYNFNPSLDEITAIGKFNGIIGP